MQQPAPNAKPRPEAVDLGSASSAGERNVGIKQREARRLNGLKQILEQPDSRTYLWDLLEFCGVARTSFTGNSTTFFNEGQRNVGLRIQADLTAHFPDKYLTMMKEAKGNA